MTSCYCCARRRVELCSCVFSTCRGCLFCLTHCACSLKSVRADPAKLSAVDPHDGLDDPSGPFADLADTPSVVISGSQESSPRA